MRSDEGMMRMIDGLRRDMERLQSSEFATGEWTYLTAPLTSTSWDGDSFSTTSKTLIDLSAVFAVPAGVKAVLVRLDARDSGSAASTSNVVFLSPTSTANDSALANEPRGIPNDTWRGVYGVVPCNSDGDIYYCVVASGAGTMDVILQIWGWAR